MISVHHRHPTFLVQLDLTPNAPAGLAKLKGSTMDPGTHKLDSMQSFETAFRASAR